MKKAIVHFVYSFHMNYAFKNETRETIYYFAGSVWVSKLLAKISLHPKLKSLVHVFHSVIHKFISTFHLFLFCISQFDNQ